MIKGKEKRESQTDKQTKGREGSETEKPRERGRELTQPKLPVEVSEADLVVLPASHEVFVRFNIITNLQCDWELKIMK